MGLMMLLQSCGVLPGVHVHTFEREDSVRSGLVRHVLDRYENTC